MPRIRNNKPMSSRKTAVNSNRLSVVSPRERIHSTSVTATDAKNEFARILEIALRGQPVVITKHENPKAVLLSIEDFHALSQAPGAELNLLTAEFDALLDRMQTPESAAAMEAAFSASPKELGRVARKAARRRV
jgi:antitoxin Phd